MLNFVTQNNDGTPPKDDGSQLIQVLLENYYFDYLAQVDWLDSLRTASFWEYPSGMSETLSPGQAIYLAQWKSQTGRTLIDECEEMAPRMFAERTLEYSPPAVRHEGKPFTPVTHAGLLLLSNLVEQDTTGTTGYQRLQVLCYLDEPKFREEPITEQECEILAAFATCHGPSPDASSWMLEWLRHYLRKFGDNCLNACPKPPIQKSGRDEDGHADSGAQPSPDI